MTEPEMNRTNVWSVGKEVILEPSVRTCIN